MPPAIATTITRRGLPARAELALAPSGANPNAESPKAPALRKLRRFMPAMTSTPIRSPSLILRMGNDSVQHGRRPAGRILERLDEGGQLVAAGWSSQQAFEELTHPDGGVGDGRPVGETDLARIQDQARHQGSEGTGVGEAVERPAQPLRLARLGHPI